MKPSKVRPALREMEVGDSLTFPIEGLKSVRAQASELGVVLCRRYATATDRETRTIKVTRVE